MFQDINYIREILLSFSIFYLFIMSLVKGLKGEGGKNTLDMIILYNYEIFL